MSAAVITFPHRQPVVTIEFVVVGFDVVLLDPSGRRDVLDDRPGVVEHAIASAIWHARKYGCRFVPGAARQWILQPILPIHSGSRA